MKKTAKGKVILINSGYALLKKDIRGSENTIIIEEDCALHDVFIRIRGNNNRIVFDKDCKVGNNCSFWMEGNNIEIHVGKGTTFTHSVHFCAQEDNTKIIVGSDCMFSNNITVRTSDSHPIYDSHTNERINKAKDVYIGQHVWIAPNTKIMKGASIGDNSIIGSDSMVLKPIPSNVLAVGHPATVVKREIYWTRETLF